MMSMADLAASEHLRYQQSYWWIQVMPLVTNRVFSRIPIIELNDGKITVDLDKEKQLQFYRLKTWFPIAIPKHPQTLPKSNDFWCV